MKGNSYVSSHIDYSEDQEFTCYFVKVNYKRMILSISPGLDGIYVFLKIASLS